MSTFNSISRCAMIAMLTAGCPGGSDNGTKTNPPRAPQANPQPASATDTNAEAAITKSYTHESIYRASDRDFHFTGRFSETCAPVLRKFGSDYLVELGSTVQGTPGATIQQIGPSGRDRVTLEVKGVQGLLVLNSTAETFRISLTQRAGAAGGIGDAIGIGGEQVTDQFGIPIPQRPVPVLGSDYARLRQLYNGKPVVTVTLSGTYTLDGAAPRSFAGSDQLGRLESFTDSVLEAVETHAHRYKLSFEKGSHAATLGESRDLERFAGLKLHCGI